jgi:hypothetical protein
MVLGIAGTGSGAGAVAHAVIDKTTIKARNLFNLTILVIVIHPYEFARFYGF